MASTRSCLECARRKIKCDRKRPCSYCTKVRVQCAYPLETNPSNRRLIPQHAAKITTTTNLAAERQLEERVKLLEQRLFEVESRPSSRTASQRSCTLATPSPGFSPRCFPSQPSLCPSPQSTADTHHLSATKVQQLWQIYLDNIDPLLKLVNHEYVEIIIHLYPAVSIDESSLLLAICFAAVVSKQIGSPTSEYLTLSKILEVTLQYANILSRPNIPTLQALTIYLVFGRLNMDQGYFRGMLAVLVELATRFKLNQKSELMECSISDIKHRHRLWDAIVALDLRTAEYCGTKPIISSRQMKDYRSIFKISDVALSSAKKLVATERHDPCEFYTVVTSEMTRIARLVLFPDNPDRFGSMNARITSQLALSDKLHNHLFDTVVQQCQCTNSPICRLTVEWYFIYAARLKLLVLHNTQLFLTHVCDTYPSNPNKDLNECIDILKRVQTLRVRPECCRWAWLWNNLVEWDISAIALCAINTGRCTPELINRAWSSIDSFFDSWKDTSGDPAYQRRWRTLQAFSSWVRDTQATLLERKAENDVQMDVDIVA